jgi:hypothetical protein
MAATFGGTGPAMRRTATGFDFPENGLLNIIAPDQGHSFPYSERKTMRTIDLHVHVTPQCFQREVLNGRTFHGLNADYGELHNPRNAWTPEQRILDMNSMGIDVQVYANVSF